MNQLSISEICSRCNGRLIICEDETVCTKCATVTNQSASDITIDYDRTADGLGGRVGPATNGKIIDTEINSSGKDYSGRPIRGNSKVLHKKIRIIDKRQKIDRTQITGAYEIDRICDKLSLTSLVRDDANNIFLECKKRKLLRGRRTKDFAASCVYVSYRIAGYPKNFNEFKEITNTSVSLLRSYSSLIKQELQIITKVMSAEQYLAMIISEITPTPSLRVQKMTIDILQKYPEKQGKDPKILAAGALYYACILNDEGISQRVIAISAKISEISVRNRYRDMRKKITG